MKITFSLKDKVVVITGAAGILGCQHADAVAAMGGNPVLLDLDREEVEFQAKELSSKYGVKASGFRVDITKESEILNNCHLLLQTYGKIDGLVNNAANNPKVESSDKENFSRLENFTLDQWNKDIAVGLTGAFLCAKHYGKAIADSSKGGVIINISSDLGIIAPDQRLYRNPSLPEELQPVKPVTYSAIKAGLIGLTRYLATYWPTKVRCNALCPGGVETHQDAAFLNRIKALIPMQRMASQSEYQGTLVFLLCEASSYMNGAIISVDGGRSAW